MSQRNFYAPGSGSERAAETKPVKTWREKGREVIRYCESLGYTLYNRGGDTFVKLVRSYTLVDDDTIALDGVTDFNITAFCKYMWGE
jgi:hypothetical protein